MSLGSPDFYKAIVGVANKKVWEPLGYKLQVTLVIQGGLNLGEVLEWYRLLYEIDARFTTVHAIWILYLTSSLSSHLCESISLDLGIINIKPNKTITKQIYN